MARMTILYVLFVTWICLARNLRADDDDDYRPSIPNNQYFYGNRFRPVNIYPRCQYCLNAGTSSNLCYKRQTTFRRYVCSELPCGGRCSSPNQYCALTSYGYHQCVPIIRTCGRCSRYGHCSSGRCYCNEGFHGNGYNCQAIRTCGIYTCSPFGHCRSGRCYCNKGYYGTGYYCQEYQYYNYDDDDDDEYDD